MSLLVKCGARKEGHYLLACEMVAHAFHIVFTLVSNDALVSEISTDY